MSNDAMRKPDSLYDALRKKSKEDGLTQAAQVAEYEMETLALDDTQRTKILSPGRLIAKRFFRNKLAIVGLCLLIFMFAFSFAGPLFYPYSQTRVFYKYDLLEIDYASATQRTEYTLYKIPGSPDVQNLVVNRFNSYISQMKSEGLEYYEVTATDGNDYAIDRLGEGVYLFSTTASERIGIFYEAGEIAQCAVRVGTYSWSGASLGQELEDVLTEAIEAEAESVTYNGTEYSIERNRNQYIISLAQAALNLSVASPGGDFAAVVEENLDSQEFEYHDTEYSLIDLGSGAFEVIKEGESIPVYVASVFVFNSIDTSLALSDEFKRNAILAIYGSGEFSADGSSFKTKTIDNDIYITDNDGNDISELSVYSIRRYSGQDTLPVDFKHAAQEVIEDMREAGVNESVFTHKIHAIEADGSFLYDTDGSPIYEDAEISIQRKNTGEYVLTCEQITYLIDIFAPPNSQNPFGTDGDGMDILARMMYGGRISLLVGFVVVFLEIIIGVILGGISGFFGGAIDTFIMRIVDVFYCIPSLAILIILGAMFDKLKMDPYTRLMWMMVILGILGWAGIARLVRGQILSLREQEFMTAQEATGMKNRRRIFRHLVPNVMPLLIVTATMNIGGVIIYESTLSFLGLGVKHPLATWGTMINSVTGSSEAMTRYAYIWVPVGCLICLTVIAFNFVGDGLRDAFDPKMKT